MIENKMTENKMAENKMTEKLFYKDSHMATFSAIVTSCQKAGDFYEAVLDRTAFFPEGGGQYSDTGKLDGIEVIDVQEKAGVIYHTTTGPLSEGKRVQGQIDWEERFSKMQQHSGEHIVSGLVHSLFGYSNVGFHMGKDAVTMDFSGVLSRQQLREIERKANEAVVKNLDMQVLYPTKEELGSIEYRSKIEIDGQVRIVVIPGYDSCACCAPHVKKTGEIGIIKLIGLQNYKGGVRVSMLCGFRALADYNEKADNVRRISVLLSAKENEVADETEKLKTEISVQKNIVAELQKKLLMCKVESIPEGQKEMILFETDMEGNSPRELVNLLLKKGTKLAAVFSGTKESGYRYVIGSKCIDVRPIAKMLSVRFSGRGGGKPEMIQGSVVGDELEIREEVIKSCSREI